jgi:hypothetical protein
MTTLRLVASSMIGPAMNRPVLEACELPKAPSLTSRSVLLITSAAWLALVIVPLRTTSVPELIDNPVTVTPVEPRPTEAPVTTSDRRLRISTRPPPSWVAAAAVPEPSVEKTIALVPLARSGSASAFQLFALVHVALAVPPPSHVGPARIAVGVRKRPMTAAAIRATALDHSATRADPERRKIWSRKKLLRMEQPR